MNPRENYERILKGITDIDTRRVARELTNHIGQAQAIEKRVLVVMIYGKYNSTTERQIRDIVRDLVITHRMAVCTSSGVSGYWLAANHDEAVRAAKDLESRIEDLRQRAQALRLADLPVVLPEDRAQALQGSLL